MNTTSEIKQSENLAKSKKRYSKRLSPGAITLNRYAMYRTKKYIAQTDQEDSTETRRSDFRKNILKEK